MRYFIGLIMLASAVVAYSEAAAQQLRRPASNYQVRGQLTNAPAGTQVLLTDDHTGQRVPVDSALTDSKGRFRLRGAVAGPGVYSLRVAGQRMSTDVALAPGSRLRVRADATQLRLTGAITGTPEAAALSEMNQEQFRLLSHIDTLVQRRATTTDTAALRRIGQEWDATFAAFRMAARRVAGQASYVAPYVAAAFLSGTDDAAEVAFLDSATTRYMRQWPASPHTQQLQRYQDMRKATAIGRLAPDIQLPTPAGALLALSSLRGKYVLIDFWASWCGPCRQENPALVRIYQQFQGKGFEIYGVSADSKKEAWLSAIQKDGLPWPQVRDEPSKTSVAGTVYNIYRFPSSFLLDATGRIIAKDLRGEDLAKKLAELMP
ncbi:redoxin domain-containing protein [Hymenobacter puniceus]|uniref:redoxin domain-containing protein n=1 Tax=Hymenobacter sp. BT190 TaxID=2763505 RepID=UPI001651289D|nr:redoxin domain-containing protein [Hymenobacter sp. BT190]MBC6699377.1 AhpC/TSA family protein [Hymenobacter sp. BT190]